MTHKIRQGQMRLLAIAVAMALISFCFPACGGNGETDSKPDAALESSAPPSKKTAVQPSSEKSPAGWNTFQVQGLSISFPGNWDGDEGAGVWWPGEGSLNMGRPPISVHCGGIPLMPGTNFDERVVSHINGTPQEKQNVSRAGFSGFSCSWEFMGKKHLGLFLEEKIGGGMGVIHFVDCQAPDNDFDQYRGDFEKIIASVKK